MKKRLAIALFTALAVFGITSLIVGPVRFTLIGSDELIEKRLLLATPLGSAHEGVLNWLEKHDIPASFHRSNIPPGSDYPPTDIGGSSYIRSHLGYYRLVFRTDVEAFYIFDQAGELVDLEVRKSVDAL